VCDALNRSSAVRHPTDGSLTGVTGVVFTGLAHDPEAHLRNLLVRSTGAVDLSGSGTGTAAVMAVLDAMGMLPGGQPFVHEGLAGALVRGRVTGRTMVGETAGLVTEVEGSAWVTGEHTFFLDDDDPLTMRLS
jgi:proline racemase